jgi:hypothetical protein
MVSAKEGIEIKRMKRATQQRMVNLKKIGRILSIRDK